eukprot:m.338911 g.338911  ORF g.338911 m.338911 type:complete len:139 (-) comp16539_c0_seq7:1415-1831(-)
MSRHQQQLNNVAGDAGAQNGEVFHVFLTFPPTLNYQHQPSLQHREMAGREWRGTGEIKMTRNQSVSTRAPPTLLACHTPSSLFSPDTDAELQLVGLFIQSHVFGRTKKPHKKTLQLNQTLKTAVSCDSSQVTSIPSRV